MKGFVPASVHCSATWKGGFCWLYVFIVRGWGAARGVASAAASCACPAYPPQEASRARRHEAGPPAGACSRLRHSHLMHHHVAGRVLCHIVRHAAQAHLRRQHARGWGGGEQGRQVHAMQVHTKSRRASWERAA